MKFAMPFVLNSTFSIEPDEYNIEFTSNSDYDDLIDFFEGCNKIVNVHFQEDINFEKIKILKKLYSNFRVRLSFNGLHQINTLEELGVPYILDVSIPINSYLLLDWAIQHHPQGIYITDDLMYNLDSVYALCEKNNIKLRIILNAVPATSYELFNNSKIAPIYRPQDYELLDKYFEVGEFNCRTIDSSYDLSKCKTLYNKWYTKHYWEDDLRYITPSIGFVIFCPCVPPELAVYRSNCKMACKSYEGNGCNRCNRLYNFAERNFELGLAYAPNVKIGLPPQEILLEILEKKENDND